MLAKVGEDPDSSVDNSAKVEQPDAVPISYDVAHPKESAMTPDRIHCTFFSALFCSFRSLIPLSNLSFPFFSRLYENPRILLMG